MSTQKGLFLKYFVLKPRSSKSIDDLYAYASRVAMNAYAGAIENENPELAQSLRNWIKEEEHRIEDYAHSYATADAEQFWNNPKK